MDGGNDRQKKEGYEVSITGKVFVSDRDLLEQKYAELKEEAIQTEKEYAELKIKYAKLRQRIDEYNLCGNTVNKQSYNEVVNENTVLKQQIGRMKCCGNCKNCENYFTKYHGLKHWCKKLGRKCDDCILNDYYHWELAK